MEKFTIKIDDLGELTFINLLASSYGKENKKLEVKIDIENKIFTYLVTSDKEIVLETMDLNEAIEKFNNC